MALEKEVIKEVPKKDPIFQFQGTDEHEKLLKEKPGIYLGRLINYLSSDHKGYDRRNVESPLMINRLINSPPICDGAIGEDYLDTEEPHHKASKLRDWGHSLWEKYFGKKD